MEKKRIHWVSEFFGVIENLLISGDNSFEVKSTIETKAFSGKDFCQAVYSIEIDKDWNLRRFWIRSDFSGDVFEMEGSVDADANWNIDGSEMPGFCGCRYIDILPTPFTNTLPIKNLDFGKRKVHEIEVLYLDLTMGSFERKRQRYTKVSETEFLFETIPADFEAVIVVDADGLVTDYPGLFRRLDL